VHGPLTAKKTRRFADRIDCGGQSYALRRAFGQPVQAFQTHSEMRTALGAGQGMYLVHDHGGDGG